LEIDNIYRNRYAFLSNHTLLNTFAISNTVLFILRVDRRIGPSLDKKNTIQTCWCPSSP